MTIPRIINAAFWATILLVMVIATDPLGMVHQPQCPTHAC